VTVIYGLLRASGFSAAAHLRPEASVRHRAGGEPDDAVIEQVLAGNTAIFELLMRRYNERLYRAVRSIIRDEREVEEVMQQAYVNAFTHLRQFNGSARFSTWLTRIAINEALARVRRRGRYEAFDEEFSNVEPFMTHNPSENPERQAFVHELRGLLEEAIDRLRNGIREVFVLREVEGLSMSTLEVAECLGVSEDVVKDASVTCASHAATAADRAYRINGPGSIPILSSSVRSGRHKCTGKNYRSISVSGLRPASPSFGIRGPDRRVVGGECSRGTARSGPVGTPPFSCNGTSCGAVAFRLALQNEIAISK
jgi:RNA polymerase sigma-70 factor (ECF subfamily)